MNTLQERLAFALPGPHHRGFYKEVASLCEVSGPTVTAWFKKPEKVATISRANAEKLCCKYQLQVQPQWLAEGTGPRDLINDQPHAQSTEPAKVSPSASTLPEALALVATALSSATPEKRRALLEVLVAYAANPQAEGGSLSYLQAELEKSATQAQHQGLPLAEQAGPAIETRVFAGKPPSTDQNINPHTTGVFSSK